MPPHSAIVPLLRAASNPENSQPAGPRRRPIKAGEIADGPTVSIAVKIRRVVVTLLKDYSYRRTAASDGVEEKKRPALPLVRELLEARLVGLGLSVVSAPLSMHLRIDLNFVAIRDMRDLTHPHLYRDVVIMPAREDGAPTIVVRVCTLERPHPEYRGCGLELGFALSAPPRLVYLHSFVLELVDYITVGIVSVIVANMPVELELTVKDVISSAAQFSVDAPHPHVLLPRNRGSSQCMVVDLGHVRLSNEISLLDAATQRQRFLRNAKRGLPTGEEQQRWWFREEYRAVSRDIRIFESNSDCSGTPVDTLQDINVDIFVHRFFQPLDPLSDALPSEIAAEVEKKGTTEYSGGLSGCAQRLLCVEEFDSTLNEDERAADFVVGGHLSDARLCFSRRQLEMFLGIFTENFGEKPFPLDDCQEWLLSASESQSSEVTNQSLVPSDDAGALSETGSSMQSSPIVYTFVNPNVDDPSTLRIFFSLDRVDIGFVTDAMPRPEPMAGLRVNSLLFSLFLGVHDSMLIRLGMQSVNVLSLRPTSLSRASAGQRQGAPRGERFALRFPYVPNRGGTLFHPANESGHSEEAVGAGVSLGEQEVGYMDTTYVVHTQVGRSSRLYEGVDNCLSAKIGNLAVRWDPDCMAILYDYVVGRSNLQSPEPSSSRTAAVSTTQKSVTDEHWSVFRLDLALQLLQVSFLKSTPSPTTPSGFVARNFVACRVLRPSVSWDIKALSSQLRVNVAGLVADYESSPTAQFKRFVSVCPSAFFEPAEALAAPEATALSLEVLQFDKRHSRYPGCDLAFHVRVQPPAITLSDAVRSQASFQFFALVYIHTLWQELIDYFSEGWCPLLALCFCGQCSVSVVLNAFVALLLFFPPRRCHWRFGDEYSTFRGGTHAHLSAISY